MSIEINSKTFLQGQPEQLADNGEVIAIAVPDQWDVMATITMPSGSMTSSFRVEAGPDATDEQLAKIVGATVGVS